MKGTLSFVLFIAFLLVQTTYGKDVFINSTVASTCTAEYQCYFFNATLWVNETAPEANDAVFIYDLLNTSIILIMNRSIDLGSILIDGPVELIILGGANVTAANFTLVGATVNLQENAQIISTVSTHILNNSQLHVISGAFAQDGVRFLLDDTSVLTVYYGYLGLHASNSTIHGVLTFTTNSMFFATGSSLVFVNQNITFQITPTIYNAYYENSRISYKLGLRGAQSAVLTSSTVNLHSTSPPTPVTVSNYIVDSFSTLGIKGIANCVLANVSVNGTLFISTSNVIIQHTPGYGFASPLVFGGISSINATDLRIDDVSFTTGENGEAANVTFETYALYLQDEIDIPQAIINSAYLDITGAIHIEGTVYVKSYLNVQDCGLTVYGDIHVGYSYGEFYNDSSAWLDQAQIVVNNFHMGETGTCHAYLSQVQGNFTLHTNSTLTHHNTSFHGLLNNHGHISMANLFSVENYTQSSHGNLVSVVDLANLTSGYLSASGSAVIDGSISYYVDTPPDKHDHKVQLLVVSTVHGLTGKFSTDPVEVSTTNNKASVQYSVHDAYLIFGSSPSSASKWWVWLLVVLGILALAGVVFFIIRKVRTRGDYTPVGK